MTLGLRERKKLATRRALHRAALGLVAERGLEAVTVEDIAQAADVSVRTLFNYFPSKEDAVLGLPPEDLDDPAAQLARRPHDEHPAVSLRVVSRQQAAAMVADRDVWAARMGVVEAHPVLMSRLVLAFGRAEEATARFVAERTGGQPHDLYPLLLAGVSGAAMRSALRRWVATDFSLDLSHLLDQAWDTLSAGLGHPAQEGTTSP